MRWRVSNLAVRCDGAGCDRQIQPDEPYAALDKSPTIWCQPCAERNGFQIDQAQVAVERQELADRFAPKGQPRLGFEPLGTLADRVRAR